MVNNGWEWLVMVSNGEEWLRMVNVESGESETNKNQPDTII